MKRFIGITLLAITLISGCIKGAIWQYERYQHRHASNELIRTNVAKPAIDESALLSGYPKSDSISWRLIALSGSFDESKEVLARNRYHDGKYGFGVITLFTSTSGKRFWVDRGWVQAGKDALTPPEITPITSDLVTIEARVRVESIENQVGGSVFALPGSRSNSSLVRWNKEASIVTEPVYLDLISTSDSRFTPKYPTLLPTLSDGPHLAYSFQWILFAGIVLFGWFLVLREDRRHKETQSAKA